MKAELQGLERPALDDDLTIDDEAFPAQPRKPLGEFRKIAGEGLLDLRSKVDRVILPGEATEAIIFRLAGKGEEKARNAQLFMENFATADSDAATNFIWELTRLLEADGSEASEGRMHSALALIRGMDPQNELETMLALQILAIHEATMTHARRVKQAQTLAQMEYAERALNRFARTQVMQIEALKKLRGKGEQKVTVRHVHVHDGGQAVVGNVTGGGRP